MAGNAMSGEKIFMSKCAQCHNLDRGGGAAQKQGPNLNGLFGRRFGACPEYLFTSENKNSTLVWEESALPEHLLDSNKCIPGTKTNFPGLGKQQDCIDLTDYLKQQKKTSLSVPSAVISSKNNLSQIQSYIIRSWKEFHPVPLNGRPNLRSLQVLFCPSTPHLFLHYFSPSHLFSPLCGNQSQSPSTGKTTSCSNNIPWSPWKLFSYFQVVLLLLYCQPNL
ncbi:uncharacterized protein A4U43_C04F27900 [Asparagus officinalis]|uniref:Cytochrome c domain-containing protein n=1 Tax=Asparagus officinalis TaxID=4686 RepID=A0A5P1F939_ASPOF|nr:uncharacterized protein A4U43_C04F27900 [Asparagus officinalis]